ncbi:MAG TPA: hypothetical protein ENN19_09550 [Chloroflexi bacterium]|nr:hypothetical protein [Chloroflexota bacterium]
MSEVEIHLLRQRLDAGRMNQVKRGTYRQCLPTGSLRLPDGTVVKDPDEQVRHAIELVVSKFNELGPKQQNPCTASKNLVVNGSFLALAAYQPKVIKVKMSKFKRKRKEHHAEGAKRKRWQK